MRNITYAILSSHTQHMSQLQSRLRVYHIIDYYTMAENKGTIKATDQNQIFQLGHTGWRKKRGHPISLQIF